MSEFLHEHMSFLFVNPLLTIGVLLLLLIVSFIVDHQLKKVNRKIKEKRLAAVNAKLQGGKKDV